MSGILAALAGSGSGTQIINVTVGLANPTGYVDQYGYVSGYAGSISPTTWNGYTVSGINWGLQNSYLWFQVSATVSNTGFSQLVIAGQTFLRTSATFTSGTNSYWQWTTATNPFPTTGAVVPVTIYP